MFCSDLQQTDRCHYVLCRAPKRVLNAAIDGAVGGQMEDVFAFLQSFFQERHVRQIAVEEADAVDQGLNVLGFSSGQIVDDSYIVSQLNQLPDQVRAYKSCPTGDDNSTHSLRTSW